MVRASEPADFIASTGHLDNVGREARWCGAVVVMKRSGELRTPIPNGGAQDQWKGHVTCYGIAVAIAIRKIVLSVR